MRYEEQLQVIAQIQKFPVVEKALLSEHRLTVKMFICTSHAAGVKKGLFPKYQHCMRDSAWHTVDGGSKTTFDSVILLK